MRALILLSIVLLLTACARESGKGLLGINNDSQTQKEAAITGQIIGDIYSERACTIGSDCGPGQECVNERCAAKQRG